MLDFFFRKRSAGDAGADAARAHALLREGQKLAAGGLSREAVAAFERALTISPENADLYHNRGNALVALGRVDEALADYARVLELAPGYAGAAYNRGVVLRGLGRRDEAIAALDRALSIRPDYADALNTRAVCLTEKDRPEEALASFERLASIAPDYPDVLGNIAYCAGHVGDWAARERVTPIIEDSIRRGTSAAAPFVLLGLSGDAAMQLACARAFVEARHPSRAPKWRGGRYGHPKIRVAYLSGDFHDHAVSYLLAGVFEEHDRDKFEINAVSFGLPDQGPMRARLSRAFDRFLDVKALSDIDVARMLREMEIDIAVDLMGHTGGSRPGIFAQRPAPAQVNYLGYPGTTGAGYMDYVLADRFVIPEDQRRHYSENVVYLPETFQANDERRPYGLSTTSRLDAGLPADALVYASFNNSYKITREMFSAWMSILRGVEGSVLWLFAGNAAFAENLRRAADERGIDTARLVFADRVGYADHLARLRLADVFLDTIPFNGGTTASDALWAGVPILTCAGNAFAARMAGSLLLTRGMPELVTHSLADYEALGIELGKDPGRLRDLKQRLEQSRTTTRLFDTGRFVRHLEAAYTTMWNRAERGESAHGFAVERLPA